MTYLELYFEKTALAAYSVGNRLEIGSKRTILRIS